MERIGKAIISRDEETTGVQAEWFKHVDQIMNGDNPAEIAALRHELCRYGFFDEEYRGKKTAAGMSEKINTIPPLSSDADAQKGVLRSQVPGKRDSFNHKSYPHVTKQISHITTHLC